MPTTLLTLLACSPGAVSIGTPEDSAARSDDTGAPAGDPDDRLCALVSDLQDPYFLEGDEISFVVDCSGALPLDEAELSLFAAPDGAEFDPEARRLTWATDLSDGGPHDIVFRVRARGSSDVPEAASVRVWVADDWSDRDNALVDPATYTEEWGLPVLHVDVRGSLSQEDTRADVTWMGREYAAEIKIRGAASASYPKNSFTLELTEEEIEVPGWGDSRNHLVLLTTFDDNSYVRQKLIYDQWAAMAEFAGDEGRLTPRSDFVVLFLEGEYYGLYVLLDRIDDEFVRHHGYAGEGNLYKSVNHDANFYLTDANGNWKSNLAQGYEKKEGEPDSDYSDLQALVEFTGNASDEELLDGAAGWLNVEEFMDWQLLVTYSSSGDSAGKNAYLYNEGDGQGFRYVPWDFNHAWGQNWYTARISASSVDSFTSRNRVFLAFDRIASDAVWARFDAMRAPGGPFDTAWLHSTLDGYYDRLGPSAQRDWEKWEDQYHSYSRWASTRNSYNDWQDFEGERDYLYAWIEDRAAVYDALAP